MERESWVHKPLAMCLTYQLKLKKKKKKKTPASQTSIPQLPKMLAIA
jgi:hypothetical protein